MHRVSKIVLIILGSLMVLGLVLLIGANLYLQSASTRAQVQAQLSEALGMPVELKRVDFGLSGLQLQGVRVPQGAGALLEASAFRADYRLLPLLSRRLELGTMVLESPRVRWAQNEEGKWVLPLLPKKEKPEKIELPQTAPKVPKPKEEGLQVIMQDFAVRGGTVELLDRQARRLLIAYDVNMQYSLAQRGVVEGSFGAERIVWEEVNHFKNVRSKLRFEKGELRLQDLFADLAGGRTEVQLTLQTEEKNSPFHGTLKLTALDLAQLSAEHGWKPNQAAGRLDGQVEFSGTLRKAERTAGKGSLQLMEGRFSQLNLFQTVGTILQINDLMDLRVRQGSANFKFGDKKVELNPLVLNTGDLEFSTTGFIHYDRDLDLAARLSINQRILQGLPTLVTEHFDQADSQGRRGITFTVKGTTDRPRPNLVERVIGQSIGSQFDNLIGSIFANEAKRRQEKELKKQREEEEKKARKEQEKEKEKAKKNQGVQVEAKQP